MNELIKKVTEQAVVATEQELYRLSQSTDGMPAYKDVFNQKFAVLIVKECAKVARNTDLEDVEGGDSAVLRAASEAIENYFGVK